MPRVKPRITDIPTFANEDEERAWWEEHHAEVDYGAFPTETLTFDIAPRQRRSKSISLRVEPELVERYRTLAAERGMGYQSLMLKVLHAWKPKGRRGPTDP
jgi:predicted DNA binding CopG/RHH family protein